MGRKGRRITDHRQRVAKAVGATWTTASEVAEKTGVSSRMARAELTHMLETGLLEMRQTWPAFTYRRK
jgi:hypothetical protein